MRRTLIFMLIAFFPINPIYSLFDHSNECVVVGDNVNVRENSNIESKITTRLSLGQTIQVLKKTGKKENNNGVFGEWVYVDTFMEDRFEKKQSIKGWVFDAFLGYESNFTKITKWELEQFSDVLADTRYEFVFKKDGAFELFESYPEEFNISTENIKRIAYENNAEYLASKKAIKYKGSLYRFKNVIWAKVDGVKKGRNILLNITGGKLSINIYSK